MKKPYLYAFVAIAIWSTTATVSKLLLHSFTTIQILAVCSAMAAVFLFAVKLFSGKLVVTVKAGTKKGTIQLVVSDKAKGLKKKMSIKVL